MSELAEQGVTPPPLPSLPSRIVAVFMSPASLFDKLKERPVWLVPFLVSVALGTGIQLIVPAEMRMEVVEQQLAASGNEVTQEQIDTAMSFSDPTGVFQIVIRVVFGLGMYAFLALVLFATFSLIMRGTGSFKQLFSALCHAGYVPLAGALLSSILISQTGNPAAEINMGLLTPEGASGFSAAFLNGIDPFAVWGCVTMGVAVSRIYEGRSVAAGAGLLIFVYFTVVAAGAALGTAFGAG